MCKGFQFLKKTVWKATPLLKVIHTKKQLNSTFSLLIDANVCRKSDSCIQPK